MELHETSSDQDDSLIPEQDDSDPSYLIPCTSTQTPPNMIFPEIQEV